MEMADVTVHAGRLEIRPADHAALIDGRALALTVRELELLTELARNAERVMTRDELYERVWRRAYSKRDRSVDVYVGRLRSKLERALPGRRFIHTHTGIGYRFSPDAWASFPPRLHPFHNRATAA